MFGTPQIYKHGIILKQKISFTVLLRTCSVAQSCPTLCNSTDCTLSDSSVHRLFQAEILEWVAISYSRGSSQPGSNPHLLCFLHWKADSLPLSHRGSPVLLFIINPVLVWKQFYLMKQALCVVCLYVCMCVCSKHSYSLCNLPVQSLSHV